MRKGVTYAFNLVNLLKPDSLYNQGMQPVVYSAAAAAAGQPGWLRAGHDVRYFRNELPVPDVRGPRYFFTLRWQYTCAHDGDTVYFAHCYPYTYTDLQGYLTALGADPVRSRHVRHRVLCRTLAGNTCDMLTITAFDKPAHPAPALPARKGGGGGWRWRWGWVRLTAAGRLCIGLGWPGLARLR